MSAQNDISGKVHELEMTMDRVAKEFQQKEVEVENLKKTIELAKAGVKALENQIQQKMREIEQHKEEKRGLERTAIKAQVDLNKAQQGLLLLQNDNRRHQIELDRFKQVLETAQHSMTGKEGKKAA